jgi:hypothetical protein
MNEQEKAPQTKALATRPDQYFNPQHWNVMKVMAETFIRSQALPAHIQNAAQLVMIMQTGNEMGFKPMQSINNLYIVNGRVAMQSQAMLSKILESGVKLKWLTDTEKEAKVEFSGLGREPYTAAFTIEEATKAGLLQKPRSPWTTYPKAMLRARAISLGARVFCPDIMNGTYTLEEVAEVTIDSEGREVYHGPKDDLAGDKANQIPKAPKGTEALPPKRDPNLEIKRMIVAEATRLKVDIDDPKFKERIFEKTGYHLDDPANYSIILDTLKEIKTPEEEEKTQNPTPPPTNTTENAENAPESDAGERGGQTDQLEGETPQGKETTQPGAAIDAEVEIKKEPEQPKEETPEEKRAKDIERRKNLPEAEKAGERNIGLFKSLLQQREGVEQDAEETQKGYLALVHNVDIDELNQLTKDEISKINKQLLSQPTRTQQ